MLNRHTITVFIRNKKKLSNIFLKFEGHIKSEICNVISFITCYLIFFLNSRIAFKTIRKGCVTLVGVDINKYEISHIKSMLFFLTSNPKYKKFFVLYECKKLIEFNKITKNKFEKCII